MRPPYTPLGYRCIPLGNAAVWSLEPVPAVAAWVEEAMSGVARVLDHRLSRPVHVVAFDSAEHCDAALGRSIHPTALLAPVHRRDMAVIVLHAPHTDPRNREEARMLRHLCHEVAHVHVAEVTGSTKTLGDDDAGMRVLPWVDEGIAECTSAIATNTRGPLERAYARCRTPMSDDEILDAALRDLDSAERTTAFAHATMRVWRSAEVHGLPEILRLASNPESWWTGGTRGRCYGE